jgi:nitrous oxide reductase
MIEIVFKNGDMAHYKPEQYTDYRYDGKYFIVIDGKQWIGFYNLDCVEYIEVEKA